MEQFTKLTAKLSELFELEKADLDFGIHRIIKARQGKIQTFLSDDTDTDQPTLKKIVLREMGEANTAELQASLDQTIETLKDEFGKRAFEGDQLTDLEALGSPEGKLWQELTEKLTAGTTDANAQLEAEIYSHLTTFFSRYYSDADFISQRRIKAGATPYAVPYSGEEVMLHWANKDQYYIKSSKDLKDYTFTLTDATGQKKRVQFKCHKQDPVLNNNNARREFHLADQVDAPIQVTEDCLVVPFHYQIVPEKSPSEILPQLRDCILSQLPPDWLKALKSSKNTLKIKGSKSKEKAKTHQSLLKKLQAQRHELLKDTATEIELELWDSDILARHLTNYTKKNESDFFIHKHLSRFLNQELDFYIKNEVMHLDDIDEHSPDYLTAQVRKIKAIRTIARHIITFLAQLENFQKKIWLKKKYVTETNYCLTLDRVFEHVPELIESILADIEREILRYDGETRSQHQEWEKLYHISELPDYPKNGKLTEAFLQAHDKLMLDTAFYDLTFKYQLLSAIPDIDESLDGHIVNSENSQALRLLATRFQDKVDVIFIDPPYNTGLGDFQYKDRYQHSSWLSAIEERISASSSLMTDSGSLWVTLDENESGNLKSMVQHKGLNLSFISDIAWEKVYSPRMDAKQFSASFDHILVFARNEIWSPNNRTIEPDLSQFSHTSEEGRSYRSDPLRKWGKNSLRQDRPNLWYPIKSPCGLEVWPIKPDGTEGCWRWQESTTEEKYAELDWLDKGNGLQPYVRQYADSSNWRPVETFWSWEVGGSTHEAKEELKALMGNDKFATPKPTKLIFEVFKAGIRNEAVIMDFYSGSGTTGHATISLNREDKGNRKYILMEMGDYFHSLMIPRLQKAAYSADWKVGKPTAPETGISHAFKYLRLESYEDALNNLQLEDKEADLLGLDDSVKEDYLLSYMLDVESNGHLMNLERFQDPWGCQLKIHHPHTGEAKATTIDLVETFNYLMGFTLRELKVKDGFLTLEGEDPKGETILVIWRKLAGESDWQTTTNADLTAFITARRIDLANTEYAALYINGDHTLHDPHSKVGLIEDLFYQRMFAHTGNPDD